MAATSNSLKIVVPGTEKIHEGGYIKVVDEIVLNAVGFSEFVGEEGDDDKFTKARASTLRLLVTAAGGSLEQRDETGNPKPVNGNNCKIRAKPDKRKDSANGFSRVTVTLPEEPLSVDQLEYIDLYIAKFLEIRTKKTDGTFVALPAATSDDTAESARKFALGMMMLTRCR